MAKESTHRADELKTLGWSNDEIVRYAELWDYRQRWGAINLERDDRQFLKKAESALPKITTGKPSIKKPLNEKSYYRRLCFFLEAMNEAENLFGLDDGARGKWPILLEEELRALDYYEPVLGLPDTLKTSKVASFREEMIGRDLNGSAEKFETKDFDFNQPLEALRAKEKSSWKPLRDEKYSNDQSYPIISANLVQTFRKEVRSEIVPLIRETLPSLVETGKPLPPEDWSRD